MGKINNNTLTKTLGTVNLTLERETDVNGNPAGAYIVKHDINHTNYIVLISPTTVLQNGSVVGLLENAFVIYMTNGSNVLNNSNFSFIVFPVI